MTTTTDLAVPESETEIQPSDLLTPDDARQITDRIKHGTEVIYDLVKEAYQRRAWVALNYASWDAYLDGEFQGAPLSLPRETRKEAVQSLKAAGLSLRAIAAATGTSPQTVANDAAAASSGASAQVSNSLTPEQEQRLAEIEAKVADESGSYELTDEEHAEATELRELRDTPLVDAELVDEPAAPTTGLDGKTYTKPKPKADKAPAVPKIPASVKAAKKVAALIDKARIAYDELVDALPDKVDKAEQADIDKALAYSLVDFAESFPGITATVKWTKLAN